MAWFGLKNATDLWQIVDAGLAQMLKILIGQAHRNWLDKEGNADRWHGNENTFTESGRRILITHWVSKAWKKLCSPNYDHFRKRCWEKTGCLVTADRSEDDKITPEGLPSYKVPPPVDYVPAAETLPMPNQPTVEDDTIEEDNEDADEDADGQDEPDYNGEEWQDYEDDRIMDAPYCGRQMKILYENGWHTGEIKHYNDHFQKYYMKFDDKSEDYIGEDVIGMVEVCVI